MSVEQRLGREIAALLAGSWRASPVEMTLEAESLERLMPALLETGCGALAWNRIRRGEQRDEPWTRPLLDVYRSNTLLAARLEARLAAAAEALDEAGVDYLLVKGWAVARLYPEKGFRPYGDLDLCVAPEDYERALRVLSLLEADRLPIDLHAGYPKLYDRTVAGLCERSRAELLRGVPIRVLAPEDHLRLLCFHLWAHGAARPIWLCDIAAAVEGRGPDFDWQRCLQGTPRYTEWVVAAVGMAGRILGADLAGTPIAARLERLPAWLETDVLCQWGRGAATESGWGPLAALRAAWRTRMQAAYELRLPFHGFPALPVQLLALLARLPEHLRNRITAAGHDGGSLNDPR